MTSKTVIKNLGDLICVIKDLGSDELTDLLVSSLSVRSYKMRKDIVLSMKKKLDNEGFLLSDELMSYFVGDTVGAESIS